MLKNDDVVLEDARPVGTLNPDLLASIKKEDMKQAIVERFSGRVQTAPQTATRSTGRSPYWQPADDEC
jgi:hypothetical protein